MWSETPPTYEEWRAAKNHGAWWIKYRLCEEHTRIVDGEELTFPEAWYTEIVVIMSSYERGGLLDRSKVRMHAHNAHMSLDLSDPKKTNGIFWQPVKPPDDDSRDCRPTILKEK